MEKQCSMRERILTSVEELIATRGVNNFSLRDICDLLNISTGSLYYHFKTKDDIIMAIINKHFAELENDYNEWLIKHKVNEDLSKERFIEIVLYKGTELFNRSKIHIYLINECMRANNKLKDAYKDLIQQWYEKIEVGVKQVYGERDDADAIAYMILLIVEGLTVRVVLDNRLPEPEIKMKKLLTEL